MSFYQFILILKARRTIVLLIFAAAVLGTLIVSLLTPKSYTASTSLILNYKGIDPVTGSVLPAQLMPGYMATQVDIIKSHSVAGKVVDALKFADSAQAQAQFQSATNGKGTLRDWYADLLLKKLDIQPSRESSVIELTFSGSDPEFVATVVNAFASAYQEASLQLKIAPAQRAAAYLNSQTKVLRENLEQAQTRLSKYQQDNGITSGVEQMDTETAKLNDLTAQLVLAQSQAIDATSRQAGASGNAELSPDIAASPLIQNLKAESVRAESKLADIAERFGVNHPQYQSAKAEADKLKSQLLQAMSNTAASVGGSARINQQRETALSAQVAGQKTKVLALNRLRDQLVMLQKDVDNTQHSLEAVNQRFTQTNLEGQGNQTDVGILNTAVAPLSASSPKTMLNLVFSIFCGTILGVCIALLAEMLDRRVRSAEDMLESLEVPVLGVIVSETKNRPLLSAPPLLRLGSASDLNN